MMIFGDTGTTLLFFLRGTYLNDENGGQYHPVTIFGFRADATAFNVVVQQASFCLANSSLSHSDNNDNFALVDITARERNGHINVSLFFP
jgi:hypothetical protein